MRRIVRLGGGKVNRWAFRGSVTAGLLPEDHSQAAAPVFRQTHSRDFDLTRKILPQNISGRMELEPRRNQIEQRRFGLQLHAGKTAVAVEVVLLLMPGNPKPIIGGLQQSLRLSAR